MKPDDIKFVHLQLDDEDKRKMIIDRLQGKKVKYCKFLVQIPFDDNIVMPDSLVAKFDHPIVMSENDTLELRWKFTAVSGNE